MNRPRFIILVGIPGCGKTTYAKSLSVRIGGIHISSDAIRKELYGDENIQDDPGKVFSLMHNRTLEALGNGIDVVYDATNVSRKDRASIMSKMPKYVNCECHIVWAPIETCIERDAQRERSVGKEVIDRMVKRFQAPYYDEGFDSIEVIMPNIFDVLGYMYDMATSINIPHDNPYHTYSIYTHCEAAGEYLRDRTDNYELIQAGCRHDIGKAYTKAFKDTKGNDTDVAHYYQHQCVGAWQSDGIVKSTPYIAWLISTHMEPFFKSKYYNNLPPFMKKDIDLLHEADLNAH